MGYLSQGPFAKKITVRQHYTSRHLARRVGVEPALRAFGVPAAAVARRVVKVGEQVGRYFD
jgi:ribosomal protein S5